MLKKKKNQQQVTNVIFKIILLIEDLSCVSVVKTIHESLNSTFFLRKNYGMCLIPMITTKSCSTASTDDV